MRLLAALGAALWCTSAIAAPSTPLADNVERALKSVSSVSFYFVDRTENYDYSNDTMRAEAGVTVKRACGGNCHNFMRLVLDHLQASKPSNCPEGQQNLLIDFGDNHLVYSYSGRLVRFQGKCYYNPVSISSLLSKGFFFD